MVSELDGTNKTRKYFSTSSILWGVASYLVSRTRRVRICVYLINVNTTYVSALPFEAVVAPITVTARQPQQQPRGERWHCGTAALWYCDTVALFCHHKECALVSNAAGNPLRCC